MYRHFDRGIVIINRIIECRLNYVLYRFDNILHNDMQRGIIFSKFSIIFWSKKKIFYIYYSSLERRIIKLENYRSRTINGFRVCFEYSTQNHSLSISNFKRKRIYHPCEIVSNWVRGASVRIRFLGIGERKEGEKRVARVRVLNSYENPNSICNNPGWVFTRSLRNTVCL